MNKVTLKQTSRKLKIRQQLKNIYFIKLFLKKIHTLLDSFKSEKLHKEENKNLNKAMKNKGFKIIIKGI